MRELLAARGIQLTKSLGQNFLHDANQLRRIIKAAELSKADKVLEIGPGLGPLTELLLQNAGEVLAIEKDVRLVEFLRERFKPLTPALSPPSGERVSDRTGEGKLKLLHADALEFLKVAQASSLSPSQNAKSETGRMPVPPDWSDWKLVANLPYSVASPILVELAQSPQRPRRMVATLQLEVARRLMAKPGDKDYGILTLLVQLDYEPCDWFRIPASCFFPEPDVDSACVVLARRANTALARKPARNLRENRQTRLFATAENDVEIVARRLAGGKTGAGICRIENSIAGTRREVGLGTICQVNGKAFVVAARVKARKFPPIRIGGYKYMPEEIFDVVNERDEVIDRQPRSEVHRLGLKHRAVHVLVFNSRGETFLQKRSMTKDREPGKWDSSTSGHVDSGEDYDACAVRELREEIGLTIAKDAGTAVQNCRLPGNGPGICVGLSLPG